MSRLRLRLSVMSSDILIAFALAYTVHIRLCAVAFVDLGWVLGLELNQSILSSLVFDFGFDEI
jgi:hypothetical protein